MARPLSPTISKSSNLRLTTTPRKGIFENFLNLRPIRQSRLPVPVLPSKNCTPSLRKPPFTLNTPQTTSGIKATNSGFALKSTIKNSFYQGSPQNHRVKFPCVLKEFLVNPSVLSTTTHCFSCAAGSLPWGSQELFLVIAQ